ncbi:UDP-N-acetylenolpyruvoylglucosamine reductase, partial [Candidatus Berkelbacteria bacterium]|nr:UDP-N-acetylenolpyruvoylglucosamine reductase [Candidatus Berkelbacteria bacterium]
KVPAGYLLEQVGAKGMQEGGIKVASYHGNLFYNTGKGKASDIQKLAVSLKNKVKKEFGIELEEEIQYLG